MTAESQMKEVRCSKCGKICAYLAIGSKIANGTVMTCAKCLKFEIPPKPKYDVPDFFNELFR